MTNSEGRIIKLEILWGKLRDQVRKLLARVDGLDQQIKQTSSMSYGWGGGGGAGGGAFWAKSPGFAAATGAFPTLTPDVGTADVYQDQAGTLVLFAADQTIRWWYRDASVAGRLMAVAPAGDPPAWNGLLDSCTGV